MDRLSPFGQPDGSFGAFADRQREVVSLPGRFGGIGRDPRDADVRVVVGPMGTGKTLTLRRMRDIQRAEGASHATSIQGGGDLSTESVARFAKKTSNTESWTLMWRRSIIRSIHTYLRTELRNHVDPEILVSLESYVDLLGTPGAPHPVPQLVHDTIQHFWNAGPDLLKYLNDSRWTEIEYWISTALKECPTVYIYLDDIDKNYAWAPSLWTQCQRGLFYEVMDLLRRPIFRNKLHVVIAIRDVTLASIRLSEYSLRYRDETHINTLRWNRESIKLFLDEKVQMLPEEYFSGDSRSVAAWLGCEVIHADRPSNSVERIEDYLIRHTRLAPRDLVIMGNALCRAQREQRRDSFGEDAIRRVVSSVAAEIGENLLVVCANQIMSDLLPNDAVDKEYDHVFLRPNKYAIADVRLKMLECISCTKTESMNSETVDAMDAVSEHLFKEVCPQDMTVRISDVFWQHRLLGVMGNGLNASFFNPEHYIGKPVLPRIDGAVYVWNPLVFDLGAGVTPTLQEAVYPGRS
jgi:hypothetical protein